MDVAEPPRIVLESPGECPRSGHAQDLLRRSLESTLAPGHAWVVSVRIARGRARTLRAEGVISDDDGATVAHRELTGTVGDCDGLARAVGVWASLVLDTELDRAREAPEPASRPAPAKADESSLEVPWPAPAELEGPTPEHDWYLHHDDGRTLEVGVGGFLMSGAGPTAVTGVTPYLVVEAGNGVFLRPSLAVGQSISSLAPGSSVGPDVTFAATRFDACLRLPGLYTQKRGLQLDLCGGGDLGFTHYAAGAVPHVALGPSLGLRGELGGPLAAELRGVAGINLVTGTFANGADAVVLPQWSGRAELALSWRLR